MAEIYRVRYLDAHTGREMLSPPEAALGVAVRYARTLEQQRGFVIRAIVGSEGDIDCQGAGRGGHKPRTASR
jgi:hypothetical protein